MLVDPHLNQQYGGHISWSKLTYLPYKWTTPYQVESSLFPKLCYDRHGHGLGDGGDPHDGARVGQEAILDVSVAKTWSKNKESILTGRCLSRDSILTNKRTWSVILISFC